MTSCYLQERGLLRYFFFLESSNHQLPSLAGHQETPRSTPRDLLDRRDRQIWCEGVVLFFLNIMAECIHLTTLLLSGKGSAPHGFTLNPKPTSPEPLMPILYTIGMFPRLECHLDCKVAEPAPPALPGLAMRSCDVSRQWSLMGRLHKLWDPNGHSRFGCVDKWSTRGGLTARAKNVCYNTHEEC